MGFKIDDEEWLPESATTHAAKIMQRINRILQEEGETDAEGNVIQLSANAANALYLLALGDAEQFAKMDQKLNAGINSFNIELCDDQQLQNLLPIAAMTRNPGSYSTITLTVEASEDGECVIPEGTRAPFGEYYFVTNTEARISAGSTQNIQATCDKIGPVVVLAGEITQFEGTITNLSRVSNPISSVPGVAPETTNELRQRLITGDTIRYSLDGCKNALEALTGVTYARVYFNYNTTEAITLPGNISLAPRHAYIVIYGESEQIAETYAQYQSAETQNATGAGNRAHTQYFVTGSGQEIGIKYDDATTQLIYVKIVLAEDTDITTQVQNQLKRDLIKASASWEIGQHATSMVMSKPFVDIDYTTVAYTLVSTDGVNWSNHIVVGCNAIPVINDTVITVTTVDQDQEA